MKQEAKRRIVLRLGTVGGLTVTTLILLVTWGHFALFSPWTLAVEGAFRDSGLEHLPDTDNGFEPFVYVIPEEDGASTLIFAAGIEETTADITVDVNVIDDGGGNHRVGYAMTYSTTAGAFVAVDTGLNPDLAYAGAFTVSSGSGQSLPLIGYTRGEFTDGDTIERIFSDDGILEIGVVTIPFAIDTYAAVVANINPPGLLPEGYQAVSRHYSLRASGATPTTTAPLELVFYYEQFNVDDPAMLSIFWWNPSTRAWVDVDESLVEIESTLTVFTNNLGVYTIMTPVPPEEEKEIYLPFVVK